MESQLSLASLAAAFVMGNTLGVFGAGGSILTMPILVYLLAMPPTLAAHYSLLIVGLVSAAGVARGWGSGGFKVKQAAEFAVPAMIGMLLVRRVIVPALPAEFTLAGIHFTLNQLTLLTFAVLMIAAAGSMLFVKVKDQGVDRAKRSLPLLISSGVATGMITGFVGAGGGFLIVPALVFIVKLPVKEATKASLFVIALNSLWGFAVGSSHGEVKLTDILAIAGVAIVGMITGLLLQNKIPSERLKPAFGVFVLAMGGYILLHSS